MKLSDVKHCEATLEECVAAAERFAARNDNWHNHVLKPDCVLNSRPGSYALVIENNTTGEVLVCFSNVNHIDEEQHIVKLRHGDAILSKPDELRVNPGDAGQQPLLDRVRVLATEQTDWHHHMCFPDCVFNSNPGQWTISLEADGHMEDVNLVSTTEPFDVLKEIEDLFFAGERRKQGQ